jgi:hypothetical protein
MWWHKCRNQISSFARNGRVRINRQGRQFVRLLTAEVCASAVVMLDTPCSEVVWRVLATHSIRQFPLHFPSRASPCAITFQPDSTDAGRTYLILYVLCAPDAQNYIYYQLTVLVNMCKTISPTCFGYTNRPSSGSAITQWKYVVLRYTVNNSTWQLVHYKLHTITISVYAINRLTPNDPYMGRTAPLTSKRCILYIYSRNTGIEYFKHALYSPFFSSSKCSLFHNANLFGSCIIHILYTECAKIKKIILAPKD